MKAIEYTEMHKIQRILAADIGGTNARFQAWSISPDAKGDLLYERTYSTNTFETFESCFKSFCKDSGLNHFDSSCFAVAGPVSNNSCEMTNLKWKINGQAISELYGIAKVSVINDFAAVGHAIASLEPSEASRINSVSPEPYGPIAVVGPGTGLGEAFMLWNHATCSYDVIATEGSHAPFAPKCPNHLQLLQFMWEKHQGKTCEIEHVCSGPGLRNIYEFVCVQRKTNSSDIQPSEVKLYSITLF
jgi:glucokinase